METINNMATAAANAVLGSDKRSEPVASAGKEPLSGVSGDTSKGEPYDAGNISTPITDEQKPLSGEAGGTGVSDSINAGNITSAPTSADSSTDEPLPSSKDENQTQSADQESEPLQKSKDDGRGKPAQREDGKQGDHAVNPAQPSQRTTGEGTDSRDNTTAQQGSSSTPQQGQGAGSEQKDQEGNGDDSQGTGTKYVQSTGLHADGGDFDVTKPGAGQEAERLLEEKHGRDGVQGDNGYDTGSGKDHDGMKSLGERIKAKFHKH